jgi:excisionase family DNA binding protein
MSLQQRFKKPPMPAVAFIGPRLMLPKSGAEYICVSVDVMRDMIKNGEIPFIRNGRRYLVDRVDLDKWIEKNKIGATAA